MPPRTPGPSTEMASLLWHEGSQGYVCGFAEKTLPVPQGLEIILSGAEPTTTPAHSGMSFSTKSPKALLISYDFKPQAPNKTKQNGDFSLQLH